MKLKTPLPTGSEGPKGQGNDWKKDGEAWEEHLEIKIEKIKH